MVTNSYFTTIQALTAATLRLARYLKRFKVVICTDLIADLYQDPSPKNTFIALETTGGLPYFVSMLVARVLSFYDRRLFDDRLCWRVGFGSKPVIDGAHSH
jgi:hypothetical protein